jgi:hypothetical protein
MGHAPPPNAPPPSAKQPDINPGFSIGARLPIGLPKFKTPGGTLGVGASTPTLPFTICGFKLPSIGISLSITIPQFVIDLSLLLGIALGIDCLSIKSGHPLHFTADIPWGGGRVGTRDPDPDDDENQ